MSDDFLNKKCDPTANVWKGQAIGSQIFLIQIHNRKDRKHLTLHTAKERLGNNPVLKFCGQNAHHTFVDAGLGDCAGVYGLGYGVDGAGHIGDAE